MAIDTDVFVIGGGVAGMTAALAAADRGASVQLARKADSTLRQATGLVDVLGLDGEAFVPDPFDHLDELPSSHPYTIVGESGLRQGLARFDSVTADAYRGSETDRNALVVTHTGTVKPTARYPASVAAGLASDDRPMLLLGFEAVRDFDAPLAAAHLRNVGVPFAVRGETLSFPRNFDADAARTRYATAFDTGDRDFLSQLAREVESVHDGESRIGFPALLGLDDPAAVRDSLEAAVDADIFEVPLGPPNIPGLRLEEHFRQALAAAGVAVVDNPVVDYEAEADRIRSVSIERNTQRVSHTASAFVLATGGLVGKGIQSSRSGVHEAVFDCEVPHPADRTEWYVDDRHGTHPYARFGVTVDETLRPLTAAGDPEYANLRAAGSVIGGYDFTAEASGMGVSLATGERAGNHAGDRVS